MKTDIHITYVGYLIMSSPPMEAESWAETSIKQKFKNKYYFTVPTNFSQVSKSPDRPNMKQAFANE